MILVEEFVNRHFDLYPFLLVKEESDSIDFKQILGCLRVVFHVDLLERKLKAETKWVCLPEVNCLG